MQSAKTIIYFATSHANKVKEFTSLIGDKLPNIEFKQINIDLDEIQGEPIQIAKAKCWDASQKCCPVITEDVSLCFNGWKGLPGPYVKSFLAKVGCDGLWNMIIPFEDKTAFAQCIYAISFNPKEEPMLFNGVVDGVIVAPRGDKNFGKLAGWDAIFQPKGKEMTFGEMEEKEKNEISHRSVAVNMLIEYLKKMQGS